MVRLEVSADEAPGLALCLGYAPGLRFLVVAACYRKALVVLNELAAWWKDHPRPVPVTPAGRPTGPRRGVGRAEFAFPSDAVAAFLPAAAAARGEGGYAQYVVVVDSDEIPLEVYTRLGPPAPGVQVENEDG